MLCSGFFAVTIPVLDDDAIMERTEVFAGIGHQQSKMMVFVCLILLLLCRKQTCNDGKEYVLTEGLSS